ncbi:MAG: M48 family metalloprotease [Desulfobacter sp.]|nr:MAG: M48 family metalloprotease [Desulfobacter sp.]
MTQDPRLPGITRRDFIKTSTLASLAGLLPGVLSGCAVDPVTGRKQLMLMSREQEIAIDRQQAPFQFSSDYGVTQDRALNDYVSEVGRRLLPGVHRPDMAYNFQCVNAVYINAYAFPGGSIAATRGILLELENEAELASLLGHELGHVNARHSAEQASKGTLSGLLIGGLSVLASGQGAGLGDLTQKLGALGQGLFLSKYSRDNEREADALGHEYMARAKYNSRGFVGLMNMLNSLNKGKNNSSQMLFATHPMSSERLQTAVNRDRSTYTYTRDYSLFRDRYMDRTAGLRQKKTAIKLMQDGEKFLSQEKYDQAETAFRSALKKADRDYTAHLLMAKCMLIRKRSDQALSHADKAKQLYPGESQGYYISGLAAMAGKKFNRAYQSFSGCDRILPGNPQVTFYMGYCLDKDNRKDPAARQYMAYLKKINYASNKYSQYAYKRLKAWGYAE